MSSLVYKGDLQTIMILQPWIVHDPKSRSDDQLWQEFKQVAMIDHRLNNSRNSQPWINKQTWSYRNVCIIKLKEQIATWLGCLPCSKKFNKH